MALEELLRDIFSICFDYLMKSMMGKKVAL